MGSAASPRRRRWRRLVQSFVLASLAGTALAASPAPASATGGDVVYTGSRVQVAAAAVVSMRALARLGARANGAGDEAGEPPEPQEKPEPNLRITLPSPFPAPLIGAASTSVVESPYVSASFLAQPDAPAVGSTRTESPPDTNGAVGRNRLMVTLNSNYAVERKSDGRC
jgi:hypothetical protein